MNAQAVRAVAWPLSRAAEAIELLGLRAGLRPRPAPLAPPPADLAERRPAELDRWMEEAARWLGLQAEPVDTAYPEVEGLICAAGPALLRVPAEGGPLLLAVLGGGRRGVRVLAPDRAEHTLPVSAVRSVLCSAMEAPHDAGVTRMLEEAQIPARRRERTRILLLRQLLTGARIQGGWLLRPAPGTGIGAHVGRGRLIGRVAALVGAHALQYGTWIASWWLLGWMALGGRLERDLLWAWMLLLLSLIPLRLLTTYAAGLLSIDVGAFLKQRLLGGVMRLDPAEIRHLGAGQLLGRTLEVEVIESFASGGALHTITALVELGVIALVLGTGAGGGAQVLALVAWTGLLAALGLAYHRRRVRWTEARLEITNDLVEQMVGHQTRVVQEPRQRWGGREDQALESYLHGSRGLDRLAVLLEAGIARGWLVVGLLTLAPAFTGGARSAAALGIGLGGVLLAYRAFAWLAGGLVQASGAVVAAQRSRLLWDAAQRPLRVAPPHHAMVPTPGGSADGDPSTRRPLLEVQGLRYTPPGRSDPVIRELDLRVYAGDRILLEGPSGGGKSTLGSLISGGRAAEAGLMLLDGLDPATLGDSAWRRRVVLVPQFHENHVLIGTFAFNVLMGRGWPPAPGDVEEADEVCRALGLGPLLDRMPSGMLQMVGETGWQLSHGERSRLFIARAVIQNPDLIILDESLAALDPETLRSVTEYLLRRESALMVIAHP